LHSDAVTLARRENLNPTNLAVSPSLRPHRQVSGCNLPTASHGTFPGKTRQGLPDLILPLAGGRFQPLDASARRREELPRAAHVYEPDDLEIDYRDVKVAPQVGDHTAKAPQFLPARRIGISAEKGRDSGEVRTARAAQDDLGAVHRRTCVACGGG
jgi:hypothetical protein